MTRKHPTEIHNPRTLGEKAADAVARGLGSWRFILISSGLIVTWMALNVVAVAYRWDPYPFILLNLVFSAQAYFAAPLIMMSQNRQSDKDRAEAHEDYCVNQRSERDLEEIKDQLALVLEELEQR